MVPRTAPGNGECLLMFSTLICDKKFAYLFLLPNSFSQHFKHFGAGQPAKGRSKDIAMKKHVDSLLPKNTISTSLTLAFHMAIMAVNHMTLAKQSGLLDGWHLCVSFKDPHVQPYLPIWWVVFPET